YEIRGELGRGMMGVVYEAYDPALGRTIALKTIRLALAPTDRERDDFERRFLAEAQIAARLSHPGIVVVHDVGRDARLGMLYIALEHLQGRTLSDIAAEGPMPWRDALRLVGRVAEALRYAHEQGVVHRDIKPANIMVLPSGEPKIMDFGIAKLETTHLTSPGQFFGTPLYMSPEQALGQAVDARTDLFSLGSVAYVLIAGHPPFEAPNVPGILARVAYQHARPLAAEGLPAEAEYVLARAMAKSPGDRYPDGRAMAEDIEDVLGGRPPRHRSRWVEPETGAATIVAGAPPLLFPPAPAGAVPPAATQPPPAAAGTRRRHVWRTRLLLVGLLGATTAGYFHLRPGDARFWHRIVAAVKRAAVVTEAEMPWSSRPEAGTAEARAAAPPPLEGGAPAPPAAQPQATPAGTDASAAGMLLIDFEHHLRRGRLEVWVDGAPVFDDAFDAQATKRLLALTLRRGVVQEVLTLAPGRHEVTVRVTWDDNVRTSRITGTFAPGATRRLDVSVGRIGGKLSLDWK
ncbi:MAG TPA: serine/threonine-protein kinase, partial [Vicinamibacteria bacterium]